MMTDCRLQRLWGTGALLVVLVGSVAACSSGGRTGRTGDEAVGASIGSTLETPKPGVGSVEESVASQAEAFQQLEDAATERIGDGIRVTFPCDVLFDLDSAQLRLDALPQIKALGEILLRHATTEIIVAGHTDSKGEEAYNQKLSERRAHSITTYLTECGIAPSRLQTIGYGALRPVAPNDSEEGRRRNQRIEIDIRTSDVPSAEADSTHP